MPFLTFSFPSFLSVHPYFLFLSLLPFCRIFPPLLPFIYFFIPCRLCLPFIPFFILSSLICLSLALFFFSRFLIFLIYCVRLCLHVISLLFSISFTFPYILTFLSSPLLHSPRLSCLLLPLFLFIILI